MATFATTRIRDGGDKHPGHVLKRQRRPSCLGTRKIADGARTEVERRQGVISGTTDAQSLVVGARPMPFASSQSSAARSALNGPTDFRNSFGVIPAHTMTM